MILMYDTGARLQEVIDVRLCDFRLGKTPTLSLHGKGDKIRTVPIMEKTVMHLQHYLAVFHKDADMSEEILLFYLVTHGKPHALSKDCVGKFVRKHGEGARKTSLDVPERVHPHLFRNPTQNKIQTSHSRADVKRIQGVLGLDFFCAANVLDHRR